MLIFDLLANLFPVVAHSKMCPNYKDAMAYKEGLADAVAN